MSKHYYKPPPRYASLGIYYYEVPNIRRNLIFYLIIIILITTILARNPIILIPLSIRIILDIRHSVRIKGKEVFLVSIRFRIRLL